MSSVFANYQECPATYGGLCCTRGLGHEGLHLAPDGAGVPVTWRQKVTNADVRPKGRSWWDIVTFRKDRVEEEREKLRRDVEALRTQAASLGATSAQMDALARSLGVPPAVFRGETDPDPASSEARRREAYLEGQRLAYAPPPDPKKDWAWRKKNWAWSGNEFADDPATPKKTPEPAVDRPARRITLED